MKLHFLSQVLQGSSGCPARCEFCDLADREAQSVALEVKAPRIKNDLIQNWILINGGDQYLLEDLNAKIKSFQSLGYKVAVTTSGLLFKDRPADQWDKADLTLIPIFSHEAAIHNEMMGIDSFDRLLEAAKILKRKNKLVVFNQLISRENIPYLDDISDFWRTQELFCVLRTRSALVDVPGLDRDTRSMVQYQARKPHMAWPLGDSMDLMFRKDPDRLKACLAGVGWEYWANRLSWPALIAKFEKFYGRLRPDYPDFQSMAKPIQ